MTTLDELVVKIRADAGQFEREMNRVSSTTSNATGKMSAGFGALKADLLSLVPALSAGAFIAFAKNAVNAAAALQDMADRTGVSASFLNEMQIAVENAGGSVDQLAQSILFMNNFIGEAAKGNQQAAETLTQLGTSFAELQSLSPEQQFMKIVDGVSQLGTQFEKTEALRSVFGRGVSNLIPILSDGADGIKSLRDEAKELNSTLSDEQVAALDAAGDAWNSFTKGLSNATAGVIADTYIRLKQLDELLSSFGRGSDGALSSARLGTSLPEAEMSAYINKAKKAGFVTSASVLGTEQYGPEAKKIDNIAKKASETRKQAAKEIKEVASETEKLDVVMEKVADTSEISARIIKDSFGDALESATFDFKNFGNAAGGILDGLARRIARKGFIDPLSGAVDSLLFGSGSSAPRPSPDFIGPMPQDGGLLGNIFGGFFADGGRPPMGKVSVVGERGPELFVPDSAGTIIPNGGMGGGVSFTQVINVSPGVPELIRSEINRAAPGIASAAQNGVFMAMEKGGRASQIVGKRS